MDWLKKVANTWHNLPALVFPQADGAAVRHAPVGAAQVHTTSSDQQNLTTEAAPSAPENAAELPHDNFLRGMLMSESAGKLQKSRKAGASYWRHGAGCSCKLDKSEQFQDYVQRQTSSEKVVSYQSRDLIGELEAPGMGLDGACLSAFLRGAEAEQSNTAAEGMSHKNISDATADVSHTESQENSPIVSPSDGLDDEVDIDVLFNPQQEQAGVKSLVDDINEESWQSLKALSDELADRTLSVSGTADQDITQDLSVQDIKRMELIELFGRSVLAAKAALKGLAADSDEAVRAVVAQEYSCPDETLIDLAHDASETVRLSVLSNPKVSLNILEALSSDDVPAVAQAAEIALQNYAHHLNHIGHGGAAHAA